MKQIVGNKREIKRIAEAYVKAKDDLPGISEDDRIKLRKIVNFMFGKISETTYIEFTKKDPYDYDTVFPLTVDYERKSMIKVNVSGNNSKLWGPVYNLMFRGVHDVVHAMYGLNFNFKAEIEAYHKQRLLTILTHAIYPPDPIMYLYERVLRSEIIYQAAYKTHFGEFHVPVQKIILADL